MATASPSTGSPMSPAASSQSASADSLATTSPIPDVASGSGAARTRSTSTTTATGITTPYDPLPDSCSSELTGEAMPSWARLVATATIGMPAMCAANLVTSIVLPPPMPATASYSPARSRLPSETAALWLPSGTRKISASLISSSAAMLSPWPGPTATATRPEVAMRRSASRSPSAQIAPGRTSMTIGAASIRARSGMPARLAVTSNLLTVTGNLPRPAQVSVVVDFHPVDHADRHRSDLPAPVREFLVAVLVIEPGVAAPRCLECVSQRHRGRGLDERRADVLAVGLRRVHLLRDPAQQSPGVEDHLHLLVGQRLDVVDGEDDARPPGRARSPGGQQRLLDADRMHGVAVDQQGSLAEVLAGPPERVGVVPLQRPAVVHEFQR